MVWETTLNCFASGGWNGIPCILGNGFLSIGGNTLIAGMLILTLFFYITFKLKLPWSFTLPISAIFIIIMSLKYLQSWMGWFALLIGLFVAGYGFYRFWKGRG